SVIALFETKQRLEVPLFQRRYVWEETQQWAPLWEDIEIKFVDHIEGNSDAPVHFLGAMVLDQKLTPATHVAKRQIIDGQQRLTTFQIFLAAFADLCQAHQIDDLAKEVRNYLLNTGMMKEPDVEKFKIWPTIQDRKDFANVIEAGSVVKLEERYPLQKKKWARTPDPRPRMVEAYLFFARMLNGFFLGEEDAPPIGAEYSLRDRLEASYQALKSSLQVVVIDLDPNDDAQIIFETLNARGEPLLPADLLRNYVFLRVSRGGGNAEELYKQYWKDFDSDYWREEIGSGRFRRPRSDLFIQYFLESQTNTDISPKHVYAEYKHWSGNHPENVTVEHELAMLAKNRENFARIQSADVEDPLYSFFRFASVFEIGTVNPLYLSMLGRKVPENELRLISGHIESYLMRRAICGLSTKNYSRVFLRLNQVLREEIPTGELVADHLISLSGLPHIWPSDQEVREAILNNPFYTQMNQQRLAYLLGRISDRMQTAGMEHLAIRDRMTIEHILPQSWTEHWSLGDGSKGYNREELETAQIDDPVALASILRNDYVNRLGNLTLLTSPLNSAQSNSSWHVKKPLMASHSLLPMNANLQRFQQWSESAIDSRAEEMVEICQMEWPRPVRA
ncbi:MAG: DUF262 domain-containing HNH endonuclease family protein, partial [Thermomicrobiales bacterium]|nr:DUF262 domain-containing HNH endonuclease family protein [Thermomicrobiales bacterium]